MTETKRKLNAIMFTDIVGYTALMGHDEEKAFQTLNKNRRIQRPIIEKYHGEWIKEMGDGILASFDSASYAVRSAIEIQKIAKKEGIALCIGIHDGEIVFENNDIFGDGVNVASRLQALADEGCILISESVYREVKNKRDITTKFLGSKTLKNVAGEIKVYSVQCKKEVTSNTIPSRKEESRDKRLKPLLYILGLTIMIISILAWYNFKGQPNNVPLNKFSGDKELSIAILPFKNMSGDPDQEMMCEGLTEEIIHHMSIVNIFDKVISRSSVMTFKNSEKTTPEIASLLDVNLILEGSYRQFGERIRITAQLIEASSDNHLWSEIYDRFTGDIFDIQSDIARNITLNLKGELSPSENDLFKIKRTNNVKAFELYQMGRFYWNKRTGEDYLLSLDYFQQAIDEDPEYGLAYAGMADTYNLMALQGFIDRKEGRDKAVELSKKALKLDDQLAEAHTVLASIYTYVDQNWKAAEQEYLIAIQINPNYPTVHHYYSEYLSFIGRHDLARHHVNRALELDPLSFVIRFVSAKVYFHRGQFQEALIDLQRCRELNHGEDHRWLANYDFRINRELGNEQAAFDGYKRLYGNLFGLMNPKEMDSIYQVSGLNGLIERSIELPEFLSIKPKLYGILGNDEKALEWLEIAVNNGKYETEFPFYYEFRNLHSNPRFQALLKKIGLSDIESEVQ